MLAKKKAERRQAISTVAAAERKELQRLKRHRSDSATDKEGRERVEKVPRFHHTSQEDDLPLNSMALSEDPTKMLRAIGDHVNTRLKELEFDDDLDADVFDEEQRRLRDEAAIAAGTKVRVLAPQITSFLRLQQKGKSDDAVDVKMVRVGHNSNAVTAVCGLGLDVVVLGDKSGAVYVVDLCGGPSPPLSKSSSSQKTFLSPPLPAAVSALSVSDTRGVRPSQRALFERSTVDTTVTSYIAAGAVDGTISIWVTETKKHMGFLTMHRGAVTGLTFRHSTLYSCSMDETLRVWSVPEMVCQDKLFGHQGRVLGIHCLMRERCATVGEDGTMRHWKVDVATQQEFAASTHFGVKVVLECVAMMNDNIVLCGATNGALLVFDVNKRRPLVVREAAHGYAFAGDGTGLEKEAIALAQLLETKGSKERKTRQIPNPITALASMPYSDVAASASYNGVVHLWRLNTPEFLSKAGSKSNDVIVAEKTTVLENFASIPVDAIVTSLYFPLNTGMLLVGSSKEPRLGRWVVKRRALNAAYIVPLDDITLQAFESCSNVEHIPASLYGFEDDADFEPVRSNATEKKETFAHQSDGSCNDSDGVDDDDAADGDAGLFTVGDDGQMQFHAPLEDHEGISTNKTKKKVVVRAARVWDRGGHGKSHESNDGVRPLKKEERAKVKKCQSNKQVVKGKGKRKRKGEGNES